MNRILENSLFKKDYSKFIKIQDYANGFNVSYNGNNIIQDDIFSIMINYVNKNNRHLELLRLPIKDDDFCAFTCVRKGFLFTVINSHLPLCKQIFAAGHELYHIWRYISDDDDSLPLSGSYLTAIDIDETTETQEDIEANAFAGLLLAPSNSINEQIRIYGIDTKNIDIKAIIRLMDIYAIPFKAMVLRLFEEKLIDEKIAESFIEQNTSESVKDAIKKYNTALRWQERTETVDLGDLPELINENQLTESLPHTRTDEDKQTIHSIKKALMAT